MQKPFRFLAGIALALLLGLTLVSPVAAQDDDAELDDLSDIEGIERLVARYYSVDFEAMMAAMSTPGAELDSEIDAYQFATAGVFQFDSEDTADPGFDVLYEQLQTGLFDEEEMGDVAIEEQDVDDLGDEARAISALGEEEGQPFYTHGLFVRDGEYIYYVLAVSGSEDGAQFVQELARSMIDAEPGDGEETFVEDGTSTGGIWDLFPAVGDEVLNGLIPQGDEVIFPEADETDSDD